jgi:hypothetical protein
MQLTWRPLARREADHELIWLSVSIAGLAMAAAWLKLGLPWPVCWFRELTGHPCATCGATRAAIAFFHGDLLGALSWNPLAFTAFCGIALFDAYALVVLITRSRRFRPTFNPKEKRVLRMFIIALLLCNWAYLLTHSARFNS